MRKNKTAYTCQQCGGIFPKWIGQCPDCGSWNSLVEEQINTTTAHEKNSKEIVRLADVTINKQPRLKTNIGELDRVLGGGLVSGSIVLLGGDPGIGKSTLLLQALNNLAQSHNVLYVSGEESPQQIAMRAHRLNLLTANLNLLAETNVEGIIATIAKTNPKVVVIDSIQTIHTENLASAPGSVGQVRESTAQLIAYAKQHDTTILIVGHVTKEGNLAGPRVLEHMVDGVFYFEGEHDLRHRLIRAIKNRFGTVNELGIFAMTDTGLREVNNPSAIFLSRPTEIVAGNAVMVTWEGTRPLLVEVQALVDESHLTNPRRVTLGLEQNRLAMLLAVLHRHAGIFTYNQDVFVNVVGGVKVTETAADLAVLLAIVSSLKNKPLPLDLIVFGEIGLSGEIRPVQNGQDRLKEASKHGFKHAIVPFANAPKKPIPGMTVIAAKNLQGALNY